MDPDKTLTCQMLVPKHPHKMQTLFSPTWNVFETVWVHFGIEMDRLDPQLAPLGISQLWHRTVYGRRNREKRESKKKKVAFDEGLHPSTPPFGGLLKY